MEQGKKTSIYFPAITVKQLEELAAKWGENASAATVRAIQQAHQREFKQQYKGSKR